ncbi:conserved hypothetical protein [Gammaproteobacteria bacterium]
MAELLSLNSSLFAEATSSGAYYAVASDNQDNARQLLMRILKDGNRAPLTEEQLFSWSGMDSSKNAIQLLYRLQRLNFVRGTDTPKAIPTENIETTLPGILDKLSETGRALLADDNGFYMACAGFHHEAAEEIAALAGDILSLANRHARLLKNNLNIGSNGWGISDPAGRSELCFYPLYVGKQIFVLIIGGTPRLQREDFVTMIQVLSHRYA